MPDPTYIVQLPRCPGFNNLYANVPGKGRVKTKRYKAWIEEAGKMMLIAGPRPRLEGPVRLLIEGAIRTDLDAIKAIPDLLQSMGVLVNDAQIAHLEVIRRGEGELVSVSLWRMGDAGEN